MHAAPALDAFGDFRGTGPVTLEQTRSQHCRLGHLARGRGHFHFPTWQGRPAMDLPVVAGDLILLAPGVRHLSFSPGTVVYHHRTITNLPHTDVAAERLTLTGHQRELIIHAITDLLHRPPGRVDALLQLIVDLIQEDRQRRAMPDPALQDLVSSLHEDPLRLQTVDALADHLGIGGSHLRRLFHRHYGSSPKQYLHGLRMDHARYLLSELGLAVKVVAQRLGYSDAFIFSRRYRAHFGRPPSHDRS